MTKQLNAIIVDDEAKARDMLAMLLHDNCPQVNIVAQCADVPEAVKAINALHPQIVFLDVDMPGYNGFQLLSFFDEVDFDIIFTTAHSEYALQAFRVSAIDYLLKPIDIEQLTEAIAKVEDKGPKQTYQQQLQLLKLSHSGKLPDNIAVATNESIEFISVSDIVLLEAQRSYTKLYLASGRELLISRNIKEFEDILMPYGNFFRPHRSYLINLRMVSRYNKTEGGSIEMKNGSNIPLARDTRDIFLERMGSL